MSASEVIFEVSLLASAYLCSIVLGICLIFAIVVMPGIGELDDGGFLRAFQVIDGIIQRNQPVFVSIWIGSIIAILVAMGFGIKELEGAQRAFMIISTVLYMIAQVTTFAINVPLNNRIKELNIPYLDAMQKRVERESFERSWKKWNNFRTVIFGFVSAYLLVLLLLKDSTL